MDAKKNFLKRHMTEIVQNIRNPIELADTLFAKKYINDEMYAKIRANKTEQEKTREIYTFLKTEEQFACTYDWLKKNEVEVFIKLEKSDRETEAPQKKRQRVENEDETENTGFADLKMICTFAKLEKWVSTPEIGEKLISDLERKLGDDGMEDLENGLKDKEPKNVLCFNAHNIDEIRKNKELAKFLSTTEATIIPKLTYSMFFKKGGSGSSENKNQSFWDFEELIDMNADVSSSGYESLLSSTFNDGEMDNMTSVNKDKRSESKTTEQIDGKLVVPMHHEVKANGPSQETMDMQDTYIDKEQCQRLNIVPQKVMTMHQNEQTTNKVTPLENGFVSMEMQDTHIDQMNEVPKNLCQNDKITKKETQLADKLSSIAMQDGHTDETNDEPKRSSVPRNEDKLLYENKQINSREAPLDDEIETMDVQDADIEDMNDEPQRSNVPDVLTQRNIYLHHNNSTTKIETPLEDELTSTVMKYKHIDETNDEPKRSNVPRDEDVLQISSTKASLEDGMNGTDMQVADTDETYEKPQRPHFLNAQRDEDVFMDKNEKIQKSDKDVIMHQNESTTKIKTPLEDTLGRTVLQDALIDEIDEEPEKSNVPISEDVLLDQSEQITSKESLLEDGFKSTDMQDSDTEDINDESRQANVPHAPFYKSIYLGQNESIKTKTPLENKSPTTDIKEIEEINVQSQRSSDLVHEGVTMHQNESQTRNKTQLEVKLSSAAMQDTQNYEINDEHKRSSVPRNEEVLYKNEIITNKEAPLEDEFEKPDMQDADIDQMNMKPQQVRFQNVPSHDNVSLNKNVKFTIKETPLENTRSLNVPIDEDVLLDLNEQINNKEAPLEDEHESRDMQNADIEKMNDEPRRSNDSIVPTKGSMSQNEPIIKIGTPAENNPGRTDMKGIVRMNVQSQSSNVALHQHVTMHQNESPTKNKTPLEDKRGSTVRQNTHINKADVPKRSIVPGYEDGFLYENEQIFSKEVPLEDELKRMVVQDADIDDIRENPQRLCSTNAPKHEDVFLDKNDTFSQKQPPLENTLGSRNIHEIGEEPQRSNVANIPIYGETFLHQNDQLTNEATPVVDGSGSSDKKEMQIDQMDEEPLRSNVPMFTVCLVQTESIINSKMPPSEPAVTLVNPEPLSSKPLQQNNPGRALEDAQRIETEIWAQYRDKAMQARNKELKRRNESMKKREKSKQQKQKKKKEKDKLLCDWAKSQCSDHEEIENILHNISIINVAEHNEYPCFTAENVMVYKYLTPESKILFITDDNTSINTKTMVHYQMFVCDIKKAVILSPKEPKKQEIPYDKSLVPIIKCKNFIFQAFAPALVVYKKIQKKKHLTSLSECSQ